MPTLLQAGLMRGGKVNLVTIAISFALLLAGQCAAQPTAPASLPVGFTATIDGKASAIRQILSAGSYVVSLEGNPCAITVRHIYSSTVAHLVWVANFFVGSLPGTKCTMTLTKSGDLQLLALFKGTWTMVWHSDTANKGVVKMSLDSSSIDSGDFRLLTAKGKVVYHSYGVKEFAILRTEKFKAGDKLVNPNEDFNDYFNNVPQELFSTNDLYELRLVGGDLQLFSSYEGGPYKQYWSLKRTLFKGDLSKVAYAAIEPTQGSIGLFTATGKVVWKTIGPSPQFTDIHDVYFGLDTYGNLKNWYLYKGEVWFSNFQALKTNCDVPNFCGPYGLCSKEQCSCPKGFVKSAFGQRLGCNAIKSVDTCKRKSLVQLTGYDSVFDAYNAKPLKVSLSVCKAQCLKDCSCDGFTYNTETGFCYKTDRVLTLRKVSAATKLAFVKL